jgi:enoyl-[acyl-carrier protein] reductase II
MPDRLDTAGHGPPAGGGGGPGGSRCPGGPAQPRALRTPLVDRLRDDPGSVDPARAGAELCAAVLPGGGEDHLPFGQSAALVHEALPAAEILRRVVAEAAAAIAGLPGR